MASSTGCCCLFVDIELVKGSKLRKLPRVFQKYDKLLMTTWGHDSGVIPASNVLLTLNDALTHSAVLIQGHSLYGHEGQMHHVSFPLTNQSNSKSAGARDSLSLTRLQEVLDLKHNCGYLTFLKTGEILAPLPPITTTTTQSASAAYSAPVTSSSSSSSPQNGIRDAASAQILQTELDLLDINKQTTTAGTTSHSERPQFTLDALRGCNSTDSALGEPSAGEDCLPGGDDWALLDVSFGIPLFSASLNSDVCGKIRQHTLCNRNSVDELLNSNRTLTLRLLNFIAENQDLPVIQEHYHESGMMPTSGLSVEQTIPLPTRNLVFADAQLQTWTAQT